MFRFVCKRVCSGNSSRSKGFLFTQDSTTTFLIRPISSKPTHENSFKVSYLVDSCGLSHEKAVSASNKINFETSTNPDKVLTLFRNHDFPDTHISKIIQNYPRLLLFGADKTLKPKLEFFNSIGLSGPDLAKVISTDPNILTLGLENRIRPAISFLKGILPTDSDVLTVIKRSTWVLNQDPQKRLAPNIAILRANGVPNSKILKLLLLSARTLLRADRFCEIVEETKKMKFNPSQYTFVSAIHVLSALSKSSWVAKCDIYKRWGWSEKEISTAFRLQPMCMGLSEKNIMSTMEFLVNKMGYNPLLISEMPMLLLHSLEKRTIPRFSVLQVLISNGLVEEEAHKMTTLLNMPEKDFLRRYVTKFEDKVPELFSVYQGKTNGL